MPPKVYVKERFHFKRVFFFGKKPCQIFMANDIQINLLLIKLVFSENIINYIYYILYIIYYILYIIYYILYIIYYIFPYHKMVNTPFVINISL